MRTAFPDNPKLGYLSQEQLIERATSQGYTEYEATGTWSILADIEIPADPRLRDLGQFVVQKDEALMNADVVNELLGQPPTEILNPVQYEIILDFILAREEFLAPAK